jgi:hypothetical protein
MFLYLVNSEITASVKGETGNGGNIMIAYPQYAILDHSSIIAQAVQGQDGNITIDAAAFIASADSTIHATGQIEINGITPLNGALAVLSAELRNPPALTQGSCAARQPAAIEPGRDRARRPAGRSERDHAGALSRRPRCPARSAGRRAPGRCRPRSPIGASRRNALRLRGSIGPSASHPRPTPGASIATRRRRSRHR